MFRLFFSSSLCSEVFRWHRVNHTIEKSEKRVLRQFVRLLRQLFVAFTLVSVQLAAEQQQLFCAQYFVVFNQKKEREKKFCLVCV